jgi:hypothetical protein
MALVPYQTPMGVTLNFIQIKNDDPVFYGKVKAILDDLNVITLGHQLLVDIDAQCKNVFIVPQPNPALGNMCTSGGSTIFYRLRAAFRGADGFSPRTELGYALMGAAGVGWTLQKIGETLAGGMSPVTVRTVRNLKAPAVMGNAARQQVGAALADMIEAVADGVAQPSTLFTAPRGTHSFGDELLRFLRPWLKPGSGAGSRVNFNPDGKMGCMGDQMKKRPPLIGLAHELCHAWRNAVGERLFDDANSSGLDDDEVMTTGFPPYQYEKYSENLFRSLFPNLPMRENYR